MLSVDCEAAVSPRLKMLVKRGDGDDDDDDDGNR